MAVANGFGKTTTSGSVFMYDVGDTVNSYRGEPTTNLALFGMDGSFNTDYPSNCTFSNDAGKGYKGRDAKKVIASPGQWNIYRYPRSGNYTATSSTIFTYSFKIKWADGHTPYFSNGYIYVDANVTYPGITVIPIDDGWYLCYCTYSGTSSPPWLTGFSTSDYGTCWICDWQLEAKSHPTPYVGAAGTRSATQGLLPLVGNSTLDLSNVSFDSAAQKIFDGTDDRILLTNFTNKPTTAITCEAIIKPTRSSVGTGTIRGGAISATNTMYLGIIDSVDGGNTFAMHWANQTVSSRVYNWNGQIPNNAYSHLVGTYDGSTARAYLNGVEIWSTSQTGNIPDADYYIGTYGGSPVDGVHNFIGYIPVAKMYNRALSSVEVLQNYNKYKTRFNLA
jgi:hypothetical protein